MICGVRAPRRALWCVSLIFAVCGGRGVRAKATDVPPSPATRLVEAALEAELAGESAKRADLLSKAIQTDRKSSTARWQSGQVLFDGQWLTIAEVAERSAANKLHDEYAERRSDASDDVAGNLEMAKWCDWAQLHGQAQFHWKKVLEADPSNVVARRALGLFEYEGELCSTAEIAERKRTAEQEQRDFKRFTAQFNAWLRDAAGDDSASREAAIKSFGDVSDVAALPALQHALITAPTPHDGPLSRLSKERLAAVRAELAQAFVTALRHMPEHAATLALVDSAVYAEWSEVRQAAGRALRPRQATDYVPLLMASLAAPIEVELDLLPSPNGMFLSETVRQEMPETVSLQKRGTRMEAVRLSANPKRVIDYRPRYQQQLTAQANRTLANVAATNASTAALNERVLGVLAITTDGLNLGPDPRVWWQAWQQYNELHVGEKSTVQVQQFNEYDTHTMSCFVAGTPVWTDAGPVAIDRIRPGDVVLSQNPETGELSYRPVMHTTIRPPSPLMEVKVEGEAIFTTRGHRFWVDGQGWEMAKFLTPSMHLHAVDRGVVIKTVRPYSEGDGDEAYNLVVDDFHTYFVGTSRLLVCDNSCPRPTLAAIPGMKKMRNLAAMFTSTVENAAAKPETASTIAVEGRRQPTEGQR
jgi:hypothetical protein